MRHVTNQVIDFDEQAFERLVGLIAQESGLLLEVVNRNISSQQYVCAGHVSNSLMNTSLYRPLTLFLAPISLAFGNAVRRACSSSACQSLQNSGYPKHGQTPNAGFAKRITRQAP